MESESGERSGFLEKVFTRSYSLTPYTPVESVLPISDMANYDAKSFFELQAMGCNHYGFSRSAIRLIKLFADSRYLTHHVQWGIRMTTLCLADLDLTPCEKEQKAIRHLSSSWLKRSKPSPQSRVPLTILYTPSWSWWFARVRPSFFIRKKTHRSEAAAWWVNPSQQRGVCWSRFSAKRNRTLKG